MCRNLILAVSLVLLLGRAGSALGELVLHYPLDDGDPNIATDSTGGNDGTISSGNYATPGAIAATGPGHLVLTEGYIDVSKMPTKVGDFTVMSWLKKTGGSRFPWFVGTGDGGNLEVCIEEDGVAGKIEVGCGGTWVDTITSFTSGTWMHLAFVRDAASGKVALYLDGVLDYTFSCGTGDLDLSAFMIGNWPNNKERNLDGGFDDFALWDEALEPDAINYYMSNGVLGPGTTIAQDPSPADIAQNLCQDVVLAWTPGDNAISHDVYLGTDFGDVSNATTETLPVYKGRQSENRYPEIGSLDLELGTTYYWRIDEVGDSNTTKGNVWRFTTNDGTAFNPYPADEATRVPLDAALTWTPGCTADSHDVYFGTDFNDVNDAGRASILYVGNQTVEANSYDLGGLNYYTTYYWRIDEIAASTTLKGSVWSFRAQSEIVDPNLLLWYKFDEGEGQTVYDSSGHEFDVFYSRIDDDKWDAHGGRRFDACMVFENDLYLRVPDPAFQPLDNAITIAVWVNGSTDQSLEQDQPVFDGGDAGAEGGFKLTGLVPSIDGQVYWRAGDDANDVLTWDLGGLKPADLQGEWYHFAFVKDETADTMSIYFDGELAISKTDVNDTLVNVKNKMFKIGAYNNADGGYQGKLDDLRIYDYALSDSEILEITIIYEAWAPKPAYDAEEVRRDVVLTWRSGDYATSHDVYFGTDFNDVNEADTASDVYIGNQALDANSYDPGGLELNTTYYWRVDEIGDSNTWKGHVWSFTVAEYIIIDDMESYCPGDLTACAINSTWIDGFINESGSTIRLGIEGTFPVNNGEQSMEFSYDNDGEVEGWPTDEYSETERTLNPAEDFTNWDHLDLKSLRLYFHGDPNNDANSTEQMYVGLEDSNGAYVKVRYGDGENEDMNDIQKAEWLQWNIKLSDLADAGLDLGHVSKIYLGFGDKDDPVAGGSGVVYFDDIRLYIQTCVPHLLKPAADLNDDCIVDLGDLQVMAEDWLKRDFMEPEPPSDSNLLVEYTFDTDLADTSGNGRDGINGGSAAVSGGCLVLDGSDTSYVDIPLGEANPFDGLHDYTIEITFSSTTDGGILLSSCPPKLTGAQAEDGNNPIMLYTDDERVVLDVWHEGVEDAGDLVDFSDGRMHNFIVTYEMDSNTALLYSDGAHESSEDIDYSMNIAGSVVRIGGAASAVHQGDLKTSNLVGKIDSLRIYHYDLSAAEVAYLGSGGTGIVPMEQRANLHDPEPVGSKVINFKDYAALIDGWLEQRLWPPQE